MKSAFQKSKKGKMLENDNISYYEVDDILYKVVETENGYDAYVLCKGAQLKSVNAGRIMAVGIPVTEQRFNDAVRLLKRPDLSNTFIK